MRRPPLGTVAVVALLAAGTAFGANVHREAPKSTSARQVEVVGATAVCPDLRQAKDLLATRVSVGAGLLPEGRVSAGGAISAHRVTEKGTSVAIPVTKAGEVAVNLGTGTTKDGLAVSATGDLAAGLEVEQVTRGEGGVNRGLAGLRCEAPKPDVWFEGGSTMIGNESTLVLANVDDTPTTINVTVFSSKKAFTPSEAQGLVVRPHTRLEVPLDQWVPDQDLLALHIQSTRGRIAAGLRHSIKTVTATEGVDWVPQTQPPATRVVVPGFAEGPGLRVLYVTNPGVDDTTVSVQVTTQDGQFVPNGDDAVDVPAGTTVAVSLSGIAFDKQAGTALAATVTSAGAPVIAGGLAKDYTSPSPVREIAYTAGALPLSGPALVTDVVINRPTESTLILTAPEGAAEVTVTPVPVLGQTGAKPKGPVTIKIPAGRTAVLKLSTFFKPGADAQLAVEVRPRAGSGPVYAARYLRERGAHGPLTTLLVLEGPAQLVSRPVVVSDPQVGTP
ncbi:MAG: hypothetical protein JWO22_1472 [Frankiales bacterium]|nr:hypothetical protein [Frankiales bacterium]